LYQSEDRQLTRSNQLVQVRELVEQIRRRMPRLGTRKLYHLLKGEFVSRGLKLGRDALNDYLRSENLLIKAKKNYTKTTNSKHWLKKHPNLLAEMKVSEVEEVFVSDITYLKTSEKTYYLSLVTDAYSRKIMGYHLSSDLSAESSVQALRMAVKGRSSAKGLIHHSDRGLQYASAIYQTELANNGIKPSMTDGYDCYQNALAERINGILKGEFLLFDCQNKEDLELLVKQSIETYNRERPHLSLQMKTPESFHQKACEVDFTGSDY